MLNQCSFIGNLGADPEIRTTQSGKKVANLRLAVSENWKDQSGERKEKTTWITVTIWSEGLVRVAEQYLRKGSKIYISGKLDVRKWQDQSGQDRYSTEIVLQGFDAKLVMLDGKQDNSQQGGYDQSPSGYGGGGRPSGDDYGDSIPFAPCVMI